MTTPSVEAYISLDGTGYTISDKGGMFPCDLTADVAPGMMPGDFEITAIYVGSEHVDFKERLTGDRHDEAALILIKDHDWLEWAEEQGGVADDCRRPAGGDVGSTHVDAGARI
jgi:hypothetical protein